MTNEPDSRGYLRRVTVDEAPGVLRVLESAFDRWPAFAIPVSPLEHLQWKMTPDGYAQDLHAVVEHNGRIAGVQLRWLGCVEIQGHSIPLDFGTDMSVHESARGLGLGSLLRDSERERLFGQRIVGFDTVSANQQVVDMYEGRQPILRPLSVWARPLSARAFVAMHREDGLSHLVSATIGAASRTVRSISPIGSPRAISIEVEPVSSFDERADELWERVRSGFELVRTRHADWLNWRYLDRRAGFIRAYQVIEGDRLLGYAAFRRDGRTGRVLDLVADPAAPGVSTALLDCGLADLRRDGCVMVDCLLPVGHRDEHALQESGFSRRSSDRAVQITRARNQATPEIIEVFSNQDAPIHLMYGDFDHG